ncbi:glutaminyl-peptide cyclotransferase [Gilvimarinus sp. SDUM040013]|uniref:Glutaminyl-peptide cyclotransferase n=1 Tax=Gilvimarinus gilvus TaxID=3058038 RepID=A0ABU4RS77_9GAMM|nr:glutaminyl-peptide cyclotransferase [Gilvimarinus sp. SDUM040013]MDO3388191.1 glutaminyl-peptide cyclotransferase [Gilvimarinus sp. SDUM040013]MDX6847741.1 glutaminyl-peptide cyclotransferase [Gilvimarinus sp. SDUM040013]
MLRGAIQLTGLVAVLLASISCSYAAKVAPEFEFTLIESVKRSPAFTQGLEFYGTDLIHSSGLVGQSFIERRQHPKAFLAKQRWRTDLPAPVFAEGSSVINDEIYLLSWRQSTGWRLAPETGKTIGEFKYTGQGWGLTNNGEHLIRSDGSAHLFFHRPGDFALKHTLEVTWNDTPVRNLNELEYAQGFIWANIWQSDAIVAINPDSGEVEGSINLASLAQHEKASSRDNVLNGIAFDTATGDYWVTGKRWDHLYRLSIQLPEKH